MAILTWRKKVEAKRRYLLPTGDGTCNTYMLNIDDTGCQCLVCTGSTDKYAEIQSYRENCDLAMLLKNIDPNALNNAVSSYDVGDVMNSGIIDYSQMPNTIGGLFNLVKQGENLFNGLPEEVRAEFNYSVKNFVSKFGTQDFIDVMNKFAITPTVEPTVEPTVNIKTDDKGDE